jgi:hypothetical protein
VIRAKSFTQQQLRTWAVIPGRALFLLMTPRSQVRILACPLPTATPTLHAHPYPVPQEDGGDLPHVMVAAWRPAAGRSEGRPPLLSKSWRSCRVPAWSSIRRAPKVIAGNGYNLSWTTLSVP